MEVTLTQKYYKKYTNNTTQYNTIHYNVVAYHPASNGLVERQNRKVLDVHAISLMIIMVLGIRGFPELKQQSTVLLIVQ